MIKAGPKLLAGFNEAPEAGIYCSGAGAKFSLSLKRTLQLDKGRERERISVSGTMLFGSDEFKLVRDATNSLM